MFFDYLLFYQIQVLNVFYRFKVSIVPYGSCHLPVIFTSRSTEELKHRLCLKNPTGQGNLALELRAVPVTDIGLPRTINFGRVDIGLRLVPLVGGFMGGGSDVAIAPPLGFKLSSWISNFPTKSPNKRKKSKSEIKLAICT